MILRFGIRQIGRLESGAESIPQTCYNSRSISLQSDVIPNVTLSKFAP